ncbi:glycosyltransferase family 1 protein [Candidatus Parcubacteria bacterium]|nr:MAG: glycosyltransferase family 1 protein [Candidatus Parcubacteria bacterium]
MRIAQVTPIYPPKIGGMGKVAAEFSRVLSAAGYKVKVFSPDTNPGIFRYGHASITPSYLWELRNFDVIHMHYPFYGSDLFVALAARLWKKPLIVSYHMENKASGILSLLFFIHKIWRGFVLHSANTILVSSFDYARSIGLRSDNLLEVPFWIDEHKFEKTRQNTIVKKQKFGDDFVFIFVGGLDKAHYFKGVDVLLRACEQLPPEGWKLLIVGDGDLKNEYESMAKKYNLSDKVIFTGRVSDKELPSLYALSDAHILPAIDESEAFGLVTLEAAASGLPSIVSDLPGVRTVVEPEKTGLLVKPADVSSLKNRMIQLLSDKNKAKQMGQSARRRVEKKYAQSVVERRILDIYNDFDL